MSARTAIVALALAASSALGQGASYGRARAEIEAAESAVASLERRADDLTAFFGFTNAPQRREIEQRAKAIIESASRASAEITGAVRDADRMGEGDADERDWLLTSNAGQVPLREARGHLLLASVTGDGEEHRSSIASARAALDRVRGTSVWIDLESSVLLGVAHQLAGEPLDAIGAFEDARLALNERKDDAMSREFMPAVGLGLVRATLDARGWSQAATASRTLFAKPPFVTINGPDPALAVVTADVRARIHIVRAEDAPTRDVRARLLAEAFAEYASLASDLEKTGAEPREALAVTRREAFDAIEPWMERRELPSLALASLAERLLHDNAAAELGIAVARDALARAEPDGDLARSIEWMLALALAERGDEQSLKEACTLATNLAELEPGDPAPLTLAGATALQLLRGASEPPSEALRALRLAHQRGSGEGATTQRLALGRALRSIGTEKALREAVEVLRAPGASAAMELDAAIASGELYRRTGSEPDLAMWHAMAAHACASSRGDARASAWLEQTNALLAMSREGDAMDSARTMWGLASGSSDARLVARCARVLIAATEGSGETEMIEEAIRRADGLGRSHAEAVFADAISAMGEMLEESDSLFLSERRDEDAASAIRTAEYVLGSTHTGDRTRWRATRLAVIAGILAGEPVPGEPSSPDETRLSAEASLALGDDAGAFALLKPLASGDGEISWYAWARMLEILERQNESGARTETIKREINRLRATDGYGSCAECTERIEAVASRLGMPAR